jgi:hypothetical protein
MSSQAAVPQTFPALTTCSEVLKAGLHVASQCSRGAHWCAQKAGRLGRAAVGLTIAQVELVHELVDDHVVAALAGGGGHILPAQHHRAALHRLAGQHFVVVVHHAVLVHHFALRHHFVRVHDDADEIVVPVQRLAAGAEVQHRQAGLGGNCHRHGIGDGQSLGAMKLFFGQEVALSSRRRCSASAAARNG